MNLACGEVVWGWHRVRVRCDPKQNFSIVVEAACYYFWIAVVEAHVQMRRGNRTDPKLQKRRMPKSTGL